MLESRTFAGCTSLTDITLPGSLKKIGSEAFKHSGIKNIAIPDSVESIGTHAFAGCNYLESATVSERTESLRGTFCNCENLTGVELKAHSMHLSESPFKGCTKLEELDLGGLTVSDPADIKDAYKCETEIGTCFEVSFENESGREPVNQFVMKSMEELVAAGYISDTLSHEEQNDKYNTMKSKLDEMFDAYSDMRDVLEPQDLSIFKRDVMAGIKDALGIDVREIVPSEEIQELKVINTDEIQIPKDIEEVAKETGMVPKDVSKWEKFILKLKEAKDKFMSKLSRKGDGDKGDR